MLPANVGDPASMVAQALGIFGKLSQQQAPPQAASSPVESPAAQTAPAEDLLVDDMPTKKARPDSNLS